MSLEKVGVFFPASREGQMLSRKEGLDLNLRKGQSNRWTLSRWGQSFLGWACHSVILAGVCWMLRGSGGSAGCPGFRASLGTSGTHTSPGRGSCGFWRRTGGSRCCTCCTRSWPGPRMASCRNTSPGPTSRRLRRQHIMSNHPGCIKRLWD